LHAAAKLLNSGEKVRAATGRRKTASQESLLRSLNRGRTNVALRRTQKDLFAKILKLCTASATAPEWAAALAGAKMGIHFERLILPKPF